MNKRDESRCQFPAASAQDAKRNSVLEAAVAVFCREGFSGASIDLIAAEAGVSRQTVYNHHHDKESLFAAAVQKLNERASMGFFAAVAAFPDRPKDLEVELTSFASGLMRNCVCNPEGNALRKLIEAEGDRYPELFTAWRDYGPGRSWSAIAACLARLAHGGYLEIDDPDLAARQFMALINTDINAKNPRPGRPGDAEIRSAATNGVRTFLRAYAARGAALARKPNTLRKSPAYS